jgi:two-component system response regulator
VVLLDIKMPKVDGLEVLRQIRASENLKLVPVVMLTSSREDRDVASCYQLGVNAFVVKPVGFESFRRVVKEVGGIHCDWICPPLVRSCRPVRTW